MTYKIIFSCFSSNRFRRRLFKSTYILNNASNEQFCGSWIYYCILYIEYLQNHLGLTHVNWIEWQKNKLSEQKIKTYDAENLSNMASIKVTNPIIWDR